MKIRFRNLFFVALGLSLLMFAGGVGTGYTIQEAFGYRLSQRMPAVLSAWWADHAATQDLGVLKEAVGILADDYLGPLPDSDVLNRAAIRGVLEELDDPYTVLLDPEHARIKRENMEGEYGGIGARVEWDEETEAVRIVEAFADGPAMKAGLLRGDYVLTINGISVTDLGLQGSVAKVRGPEGTTVVLGMLRDDIQWDVTVTRQLIENQIVEREILGTDFPVGYLKLSTFNAKTEAKVQEALEGLLAADIQALVFDLRDNGGGLLDQSVAVAGMFLGEELITEQRSRDGEVIQHRAEREAMVPPDIELVVLVNESSASASEVVAGALQDHNRGYLIGQPTFGKGSVQRPHQLSDESQLRITISQWFTPLGRSIDDQGLEPDLWIEMDEEDHAANQDPQLEAALDHVARKRDE